MKILIADDFEANQRLLREILSPFATCVTAKDGQEVVEFFEAELTDGVPFDLILLDIMMPKMDGRAALARVRELERHYQVRPRDEVKVIMVTSLDSPADVVQTFMSGGCTDYLPKPVTETSLLEKLRQLDLIPKGAVQ